MHSEVRPRAGAALAALLLLAPAGAAADAPPRDAPSQLVRRHFGVEEGLPVPNVTALAQDSDGFLWAGTFDGLARFDGVHFRVFTTATHPELGSNRIADLVEDGAGGLWILTEIGDVIRHVEGSFTRLPAPELPGTVLFMMRRGDALWLLGTGGAATIRDGVLERFAPRIVRREVRALEVDRRGGTWLGDGAGEVVRLGPDGAVRRWGASDGLPRAHLEGVFEDGGGTVWLGFGDGAVWFLEPDGSPRPLGAQPWGDAPVHLFHEDDSGRLWIGTWRGWWIREPGGRLRAFAPEAPGDVADAVRRGPDGALWRIQGYWAYRGEERVSPVDQPDCEPFFDAAGSLWLSYQGVDRLDPPAVASWGVAEGLPGPLAYPVLEGRDGTLWVGAWEGRDGSLARLAGGRFETVLRPSETPRPALLVQALFEDRRGELWVGSVHRPLCRVRGGRCEPAALPVPAALQTATRAMAEDRRGRLWIGGEDGLVLGTPAGPDPGPDPGPGPGGLRHWRVVLDEAGFHRKPWVRGVLETRGGQLLFATAGLGVLRWRGDEPGAPPAGAGAFEALTTRHGLASDSVRDVHEDAEGILWVATEDRGLCRVDRAGRSDFAAAAVACLGKAQGLFDDSLHRILEDGRGRVWLSSNRGIFWVRRSALQAWARGERRMVSAVGYDERDGMRDREANGGVQPAGIRASDGRLWFPTQDGVVAVDPAAVPFPDAPRPVIDGVRVGAEERRPPWQPLVLAPADRDLEVTFTAAALAHPEALRFRYRLAGYEEAWRDSDGSRRVATYTGLPPGRYVFELEAGLGGAWSRPIALAVERRPFVWQTPWFALACLALAGLTLASAHRLRLRTLRSRARQLERTVEERTLRLRENEAQLARQAEDLRRANELKSRFLAHVSHELRTPLTLTFGPLDDLAAGRLRGLTEEARPHLERARRNGDRLERLIDQLLDLSRLEASTLRLRPARVDLAALVRRWTSAFESLAASRGVELRCEAGGGPRPFVADAARLETVLYNLVGNALDFTPAGGSVTVELRDGAADEAVIAVRDTGAGIAPEHLPHVFERFYQADSSTTRRHEGLGIGLALSRELVELHGGRIEVESEPGEGTTFTVTLPPREAPAGEAEEPAAEPAEPPVVGAVYAQAPAAGGAPPGAAPADGDEAPQAVEVDSGPPSEPADPEAPAEAEERPLVLVVEDNADMRDHLRALLEAGFRVEEAADGARGLALARDLVPDAVVSDVTMPELDGFSLLSRLRDDPRTSHVPVLLLTARADLDSRIAGYEAGTDAFLAKPFRGAELLARLHALLEQRRRLRRAFAKVLLQPEEVDVPDREREFLDRLRAAMEAGLAEPRFNVDELAAELFMSRRQLLRKVQALTGEAPGELLRRLRLERAAALLRGGASVKETARAVGFRSAPHFSQAFREAHGATPAAYRAEHGGDSLTAG